MDNNIFPWVVSRGETTLFAADSVILQNMIRREHTLLTSGMMRDVYLVEYEGQALVVKTLRNVEELRLQKWYLTMHRREVLTMDAVRKMTQPLIQSWVMDTALIRKYACMDKILYAMHLQ